MVSYLMQTLLKHWKIVKVQLLWHILNVRKQSFLKKKKKMRESNKSHEIFEKIQKLFHVVVRHKNLKFFSLKKKLYSRVSLQECKFCKIGYFPKHLKKKILL